LPTEAPVIRRLGAADVAALRRLNAMVGRAFDNSVHFDVAPTRGD
jgi:hypothetical protein